jgi:hypothetical protein
MDNKRLYRNVKNVFHDYASFRKPEQRYVFQRKRIGLHLLFSSSPSPNGQDIPLYKAGKSMVTSISHNDIQDTGRAVALNALASLLGGIKRLTENTPQTILKLNIYRFCIDRALLKAAKRSQKQPTRKKTAALKFISNQFSSFALGSIYQVEVLDLPTGLRSLQNWPSVNLNVVLKGPLKYE